MKRLLGLAIAACSIGLATGPASAQAPVETVEVTLFQPQHDTAPESAFDVSASWTCPPGTVGSVLSLSYQDVWGEIRTANPTVSGPFAMEFGAFFRLDFAITQTVEATGACNGEEGPTAHVHGTLAFVAPPYVQGTVSPNPVEAGSVVFVTWTCPPDTTSTASQVSYLLADGTPHSDVDNNTDSAGGNTTFTIHAQASTQTARVVGFCFFHFAPGATTLVRIYGSFDIVPPGTLASTVPANTSAPSITLPNTGPASGSGEAAAVGAAALAIGLGLILVAHLSPRGAVRGTACRATRR